MADTGGGKTAFRAAKKGEGKCQRSAACLPLTNTMLDVRDLLLASLRYRPPNLTTLL
jgi:hypothetical protein